MGNDEDSKEDYREKENNKLYIKEKNKEFLPKSVTIKEIKLIKQLVEKCICKINLINGFGTGFFCKIPFLDSFNLLPVLITNFHILNEKEVQKDINIIINDKKLVLKKIDDSRKIYMNKEFDITIIEIKDSDNLNEDSFLEVDNNIYNDNINSYYYGKNIYLLYYGKYVNVSSGIIKRIDKYNIYHNCETQLGSSGCPIINKDNFKVLGIHKGTKIKVDYKIGTFIKGPIDEFKKNNKNIEYLNPLNMSKNGKNNVGEDLMDDKNDDEITIEYTFDNNLYHYYREQKIKIFGIFLMEKKLNYVLFWIKKI